MPEARLASIFSTVSHSRVPEMQGAIWQTHSSPCLKLWKSTNVSSQNIIFMTRPGKPFATLGFYLSAISVFSSQSRSELTGRGLVFQCNLRVHRPQITLLHTGLCLIFYWACSQASSGPGWPKAQNGSLMWFSSGTQGQSQAGPLALQREILEFGIDHVLIQISEINSYL